MIVEDVFVSIYAPNTILSRKNNSIDVISMLDFMFQLMPGLIGTSNLYRPFDFTIKSLSACSCINSVNVPSYVTVRIVSASAKVAIAIHNLIAPEPPGESSGSLNVMLLVNILELAAIGVLSNTVFFLKIELSWVYRFIFLADYIFNFLFILIDFFHKKTSMGFDWLAFLVKNDTAWHAFDLKVFG